ncbi:uncharacterized protein LOC121370921 [Gigantopelta aegis]|uniref:uncharacterized protein LOC121370921 n=1 Tax=Gigantopelta aegis TaxID=1735272 RepID=UPI001B889E91|nr:uncharacterized protein LOC121370921 [Gigantopelta aegis]
MPPSVFGNMKRKADHLFGDEVSYGNQRQSILDMSMCKLKTSPPKRIEPCLRRSVLILNTLKHIETELKTEGIYFPAPSEAAFNLGESQLEKLTLDPLPESEFSNASPVQSVTRMDGICQLPVPLKSVGMLPDFREQDRTVLDLVPCPMLPVESPQISKALLKTLPEDSNNNLLSTIACVANSSTWTEDLLGDVDVSLCDLDLLTLSSAMKFAPLSADEVIHSFPNSSSHPGDPASALGASPLVPGSRSTCKSDSLLDDLDNIMQILVGM